MLKVDLPNVDQDQFTITEKLIAGDRCYLVVPKKTFYGWNKQNLHFRSSVWTEAGDPVSLSFKKFFNWGERDELTYTPFSMKANGGVELLEKKDGSTLITSLYKDTRIIRTRGTIDATQLANGFEIEILKAKYPDAFNYIQDGTISLIFEWVSPTNQIVIPVKEPDMFLVGAIHHDNYSLFGQNTLDDIAKTIGVQRPQRYHFDNLKDMLESVSTMKDFEGLCVYCNHGQDIRKVKTEWYLKMHHALTEEFSNFERTVEYYFASKMPATYGEFFDIIVKYKDFEVANYLRGDISRIIDAMKEVRLIHSKYVDIAKGLKALNIPRKEVAERVFASHGKTNRASMIFTLYDGKELCTDDWKKLFFQVIKK